LKNAPIVTQYLNEHPDEEKAVEAKLRKKIAEEKLEEYAKLL
jgi:hypothetical protein